MMGDSYTSGSAYHRMLRVSNGSYAQPWLIHNGKANMAFFDGHVEAVTPGDLANIAYTTLYDPVRSWYWTTAWTKGKTDVSF
ncbi:MAG: hypothetical protein HRT88_20135 [Lentisphaeraceae bacterium]|nr:hypothetical protein [Lentisphaeraceae bacterium]